MQTPHHTHCSSRLPLLPHTPCSYGHTRTVPTHAAGLPSARPDSEDQPQVGMVSKDEDTGSRRAAGLSWEYAKSPGSGSFLLGGNVAH